MYHSISCIIILTISGAPVIECEDKYKEQQLKAGSTLILYVTITGVPDPEVTWFKGQY